MSQEIIDRLDKWIIRLDQDPGGFKVKELGAGGFILRARSADRPGPDEDVNYYSLAEGMETDAIAEAIYTDAKNDAEGQLGRSTYVVYAYRNNDKAPFARFSVPIGSGLDESALDRRDTPFMPSLPSESVIEQHMRHSENSHRMLIASMHGVMEGFIQQARTAQKTAEMHERMMQENLAAAQELATRKEERDARLQKEAANQELLHHILEKGIEIAGPIVMPLAQVWMGNLMMKMQKENEAPQDAQPGPQITEAHAVPEEPAIGPGTYVKIELANVMNGEKFGVPERLWVQVTEVDGPILKGKLDNHPVGLEAWKLGDIVEFHRSDVLEVMQ